MKYFIFFVCAVSSLSLPEKPTSATPLSNVSNVSNTTNTTDASPRAAAASLELDVHGVKLNISFDMPKFGGDNATANSAISVLKEYKNALMVLAFSLAGLLSAIAAYLKRKQMKDHKKAKDRKEELIRLKATGVYQPTTTEDGIDVEDTDDHHNISPSETVHLRDM